MRALERIHATRVAATPDALDQLDAGDAHVLRLAPDDALIIPPNPNVVVSDPHAIVDHEAGFSGTWIDESEVDELQAKAEWRFPTDRPAYAQGMVAQVPVKLLFTGDRVLVLAATIIADYLEERL